MLKSNGKSVIAGIVLIVLITTFGVINQSFKNFNGSIASAPGDSVYYNKPYKLPENVTFAGEKMPLENFDTRESLDREILISCIQAFFNNSYNKKGKQIPSGN